MNRERWEAKTLHGTLYRVAIMTERETGAEFTRGEDAGAGDVDRGRTTLYVGTFNPPTADPVNLTDWREKVFDTRAEALKWIDQNIGPAEWKRY